MHTTKESPSHDALGHPPLPAGIEAIDPEHDIDAKRTLFWLVVVTFGVFVSVWLLYHLFSFVITGERARKIDELPALELQQQRQWENQALSGQGGGRSIDEAMQRVLENK